MSQFYYILWVATFATLSIYGQDVKVKQLKIGKSNENVFASDFFNGHLYFCSDKKVKSKIKNINEHDMFFLDIYKIVCDSSFSNIGQVIRLDDKINTSLNEGPIVFSEDNKKAYFSANDADTTQEHLKLKLFESDIINGVLGERKPVFSTTGAYSMAHPCLLTGGKEMIFASNKDGNSKLYISNFENGKWSNPESIEALNTAAIETFPRFFGNTLYFVSDRAGGLGGLDIYKSKYTEGVFSAPIHLDSPINSEADDFLYFPVTATSGFFSSNRSGKDRIYSYAVELPSVDNFEEIDDNFCFDLTDEYGIDSKDYKYIWHLGDGTKLEGMTIHHCYQDTGVFHITCNLRDLKKNKVERNVIEGDLEIIIRTPTIKIDSDNTDYVIHFDSKWSIKNYNEFYWKIDGEILFDPSIKLEIDKYKNKTIQLVLWNDADSATLIGIQKTLE